MCGGDGHSILFLYETMNTLYQNALAHKATLESNLDAASKALQVFPRGIMGLTTDEAKATPEWQAARRTYATAFAQLRAFNTVFLKQFKKEERERRRAKTEEGHAKFRACQASPTTSASPSITSLSTP